MLSMHPPNHRSGTPQTMGLLLQRGRGKTRSPPKQLIQCINVTARLPNWLMLPPLAQFHPPHRQHIYHSMPAPSAQPYSHNIIKKQVLVRAASPLPLRTSRLAPANNQSALCLNSLIHPAKTSSVSNSDLTKYQCIDADIVLDLLSSIQPLLQGTAALDLLNALQAYPTFTAGNPSERFIQFLQRIETADPNAFGDDEDNLGSNWGHYQFQAASLRGSNVIDLWASVGSPIYACRLVAAVLTTCQVARWLCRDTLPQPQFFISDAYLVEITELLWHCWKHAGGVRPVHLSSHLVLSKSCRIAHCQRQRQVHRRTRTT